MKNKYKKKQIWCSNCDADLVEVGTKCGTCGHREYASKVKKPTMHKILSENTVELREECPYCQNTGWLPNGVDDSIECPYH